MLTICMVVIVKTIVTNKLLHTNKNTCNTTLLHCQQKGDKENKLRIIVYYCSFLFCPIFDLASSAKSDNFCEITIPYLCKTPWYSIPGTSSMTVTKTYVRNKLLNAFPTQAKSANVAIVNP